MAAFITTNTYKFAFCFQLLDIFVNSRFRQSKFSSNIFSCCMRILL